MERTLSKSMKHSSESFSFLIGIILEKAVEHKKSNSLYTLPFFSQ